MEQKIAIKIEDPTEEKISIVFVLMLIFSIILVLLTLGLLSLEFLDMHISLPTVFSVQN